MRADFGRGADAQDDEEDGAEDELDPEFATRYDDQLADWRRARLYAERMGAAPARSDAGALLPTAAGDADVPSRSTVGAMAAQRVRQRIVDSAAHAGSQQRRVDLDAILAADELEVHELASARGHFVAALLRDAEGHGGVVFLAPGQPPARRRFSIAHELGHYHLPSHRVVGPSCECTAGHLTRGITTDLDGRPPAPASDEDVRDALRQSIEAEANDFAAELLMPGHLVAADIARRDVSIETALRLAAPTMYDVSLTAAAWRAVQVTDEACALVMSSGGTVGWTARSRNCPELACERGRRLSGDAAAADVARGKAPRVRPERIPPQAWLTAPSACRGPLLESTFRIAATHQVISMLWMPEVR